MIKVITKYILGVIAYLSLLPLTPFAAVIVSIFTKADHKERDKYKWGSIFGTWDNPPQGDRGFREKRAPFPNVYTGWKGYINRLQWMRRNRLYNFKKKVQKHVLKFAALIEIVNACEIRAVNNGTILQIRRKHLVKSPHAVRLVLQTLPANSTNTEDKAAKVINVMRKSVLDSCI